jgi:hypothetical protein
MPMEINYVRQMQQELSRQIRMEIDDWPDIYDSVKVIDVEAKRRFSAICHDPPHLQVCYASLAIFALFTFRLMANLG